MKIAVIKLGSRIAISGSGTSGGAGETLSIIKMLTTAGAEVTAYSKVLAKDDAPTDFTIKDLETNYEEINSCGYDALVVLNGNVNYFGGVDDPSQTLNYKIINNFKGKVIYVLCDINLILKQIWPSIEKKPWASNYKKEDIEITRKDMICISQPRKVAIIDEKERKAGIRFEKIVHYPLEKFPLLTLKDNVYEFNESPNYDLLYGGTFRSGKREDDMVKFYFDYDPEKYSVEMFGKIEESNFKADLIKGKKLPAFGKAVSYDKFPEKMLEARATVIIGDKDYKKSDDLAQRIYESIMIGNVVLIDKTYDYNVRVFTDPELKAFCYVNNRHNVEDRLEKLKDNEFRKHIVELQRQNAAIDHKQYCDGFVKLFGLSAL